MAQSYKQLQKQIDALQKRADKLRNEEVDGVVSRIKVAIAHYGLTAHQLGFGAASSKGMNTATKKSAPTSAVARYTDGAGRSWGGRGPRPGWLREALASGKSLQDFAAGDSAASNTIGLASSSRTRAKSNGKGKRKTQIRYRDQAGNAWTGMGPQPRWLKEAVASGTPLEQLAV